jgi:hypothetical protein
MEGTESIRNRLRTTEAPRGLIDRLLPGNSRGTKVIYRVVNVIGELCEDPPPD